MAANENNKRTNHFWKRISSEIPEIFEAIFIIIGNILRGVLKDICRQPRIWGKLLSLILFMVFYLLYSWLFKSCENC